MSRPTLTLACDDWTIHTLKFWLRGRPPVEFLHGVQESLLRPQVYRSRRRDPNTGRRLIQGYTVTAHFSSPETTRLLTLGEIEERLEASLEEFPWLCDPRVSVSRVDLASDHLVSVAPAEVCRRIGEVNLPYSQRISGYRERGDSYHTVYHVSGRRSREPIPFSQHHRKGKQPVVVAHYPRLEALMERAGPDGVPAAAVEYVTNRVRQEVRFRREAIRRYIGPGPAGIGTVLGSLPAFVGAAYRRLRPVVEDAGILTIPRLDPEGEEALLVRADWPPATHALLAKFSAGK